MAENPALEDAGSGSGEPLPPTSPPPLLPAPVTPPPLWPPLPPEDNGQDSGLLWTAVTFFAMIATFAAAVWAIGELRRRHRLYQQRADAEYLLHTTTMQGAAVEEDSVRDYAPHNNI